MVRHNFSAFPLHRRRVLSLLPESELVPDIGLVLSQRVDAVCPAGLARVAPEVVPEVLTNTVTATVASLVAAAPPDPRHAHRAPPLSVHVLRREDEVSLGGRLGLTLHVAGDDSLVSVDLETLREDSSVTRPLEGRGQGHFELTISCEVLTSCAPLRPLARECPGPLLLRLPGLPLPVAPGPREGHAPVTHAPGVALGLGHLLPGAEARVGGRGRDEASARVQLDGGRPLHPGPGLGVSVVV